MKFRQIKFTNCVCALAQQGLPKGGAVGFELILDQEKFRISQFSEQVNYRALEGELLRTIETIGPVKGGAYIWQCRNRLLFVREQKIPFCIGDGKSVTRPRTR